jgi:large subunit ribosomal protein L18
MNKQQAKITKVRRQRRIRKQISGSSSRPRLNVSKSNTSLYLQLIDDVSGITIASAHTRELKGTIKKVEAAFTLGKMLAEKAIAKKVSSVVFDRGGNRYTGRIKAAADGAREGGLQF